jgi:hypothetical protein
MEGALYYMEGAYHQKWSKLGILLQTDASEAEMKKKNVISDSTPSYRT